MWLDELRERWQAALAQRGPCPRCASKRQVVRARGLVWERVAPAQRLDFVAATKRCTELKLGPWQWRLPEGAELAQIYEKRDGSACQWGAEGVAYEGPCGAYWSHAPLDPSQARQVEFSPNAVGPAGQPGAVPAEDLARPRALRCVTTLTTMTEKAVKLLEKVPRLEKAPRQREHKVKRKPGRHGKRR